MRVIQVAAAVLGAVLVLSASPAFADTKHVRHQEVGEGQRFCPERTMAIGGVAVRGGRCYVVAAMRDRRGAFIAFMNPSVRMSQHQATQLDSDEGRRARSRIIYLIPMASNSQVALIPVNTIQLIRLRQDDEEENDEGEGQHGDGEHHNRVVSTSLTIVLTTSPTPNTLITFVINF